MAFATTTAALLAAGIAAGGSAASGALNSRTKTSTNTPTYTPEQQHLQKLAAGTMEFELKNPSSTSRLKTGAVDNVNSTFSGMGKRLAEQDAARGFERSGSVTQNNRAVELGRANAISDTETQFAGMELDQRNRLLQMMQQFGFASPGNQVTQPGNMAGAAMSGGVETATLLYALSKMGGLGAKG